MGIRTERTGPRTSQLTCVGVIKSIECLIVDHPSLHGREFTFPVPEDGPRRLRDEEAAQPEVMDPCLISLARSVAGAVGFVATHVRPDVYFAYCVLARYMGPRLTKYAFKLIIRMAHYLVSAMHMPLVIHSGEPSAEVGDGVFDIYCDSSHGNAPDGHSYGGFVLMHRGGGALAWKCRVQGFPTDSPGAQELLMASLAYRWTLALRMLVADLDVGVGQDDPTPLWTDFQILLDGTNCERLGKSSRWLAARYAMIRFGIACRAIFPRKCPAAENVADIVTKPLAGVAYARHRATILGLSHAIGLVREARWGPAPGEAAWPGGRGRRSGA